MNSNLYVLATTHRLLHDLLKILSSDEKSPFEIGCRSKTPEAQHHLHEILSIVVSGIPDIVVEKKAEDFIVCIKRSLHVDGEEEEGGSTPV